MKWKWLIVEFFWLMCRGSLVYMMDMEVRKLQSLLLRIYILTFFKWWRIVKNPCQRKRQLKLVIWKRIRSSWSRLLQFGFLLFPKCLCFLIHNFVSYSHLMTKEPIWCLPITNYEFDFMLITSKVSLMVALSEWLWIWNHASCQDTLFTWSWNYSLLHIFSTWVCVTIGK